MYVCVDQIIENVTCDNLDFGLMDTTTYRVHTKLSVIFRSMILKML